MSFPMPLQNESLPGEITTVESAVRGVWRNVRALRVNDKYLTVRGKYLTLAVVHEEEWLVSDLEDPDLCIQLLKEQTGKGLRADIFTFSVKPSTTPPRHPYYSEMDSVAVIRLGTFKEWWEGLPQETRKNVRRAQKRGVVVKVEPFTDELIRGIMEVNNDSPVRQNVRFVHYGKSFEQVKKDQASFLDHCDFICAYCESEMVGFLKIVYRGDVASILQILPKASHQDKRPGNALIAKAVELCEAKGISYITYGLFNYGNKKDSPLREFKIRNGFGELLVPRFYIPLTFWGKFCMKLKLHRGLIGILPHTVITTAVRARAVCYNFFHSKAGVAQR